MNGCINEAVNLNPTKRNVLKIIAGIYNPLGFMHPLLKYENIVLRSLSLYFRSGWDVAVKTFEENGLDI